jgi:hypothetical protein
LEFIIIYLDCLDPPQVIYLACIIHKIYFYDTSVEFLDIS